MVISEVSSQDAIEIYTLAISYLYDVAYDPVATANNVHVREVSRGVFCLWRRTCSLRQGHRSGVDAMCVYHKAKKRWHVKLRNGKMLSLLDQGNVWELLEERPHNHRGERKPRSHMRCERG